MSQEDQKMEYLIIGSVISFIILLNIIGYLYTIISKTGPYENNSEPFYKIPNFIIATIISFILIGFIIYSISFYNKLKKVQEEEIM